MKKKIIISLSALFLFFTVGAIVSSLYIKDNTSELEHIIELHEVEQIRRTLLSNLQTTQSELLTINTEVGGDFDRIVNSVITLSENEGECHSCHHPPRLNKRLESVSLLLKDYQTALSSYITATANREIMENAKAEASVVGNKLITLTENMSHDASENLKRLTDSTSAKIRQAKSILFMTLAITFLLGVIVAVMLTRSITRPVRKLVDATRKISSGELGTTIDYTDNTEFGELAGHFNNMSNVIKEGYEKIQKEITERWKTEEALISSENFLSTTFESIRDPFCIIDSDFKIVRVNEAYNEMKKELSGEIFGDNCFENKEDKLRACNNCIVRNTFSSSDPCAKEKLITSENGPPIWLEIYTYPIFNDERQVTHVIEYIRNITVRKKAEEQLVFDALHDSLTGLPNRTLFMDRLGHVIEREKRIENYLFAVVFFDLDRFKVLNDSLGHTIGDELLIAISHRLEEGLRPGDTISRLGGDEFAILLEDLKDKNEAEEITKRIQEKLSMPFRLNGQEVFTSASIGITFSSTEYDLPEHFLRDADIAMYRAKSNGSGQYEVFDKEMYARAVARLQLETDMRQAVNQKEFYLVYQPIVDARTGRVKGVEALMRWEHPVRGLVSPVEFIPVAEETGLIVQLGEWALYEACHQLKKLQDQFPSDTPLSVSVNISCKQLLPNLIEHINNVIRETGIEPGSLALEITESMLMENADSLSHMLRKLRDMDVKIHIDDFGTGYSSLSYLHRFAVDVLKIDRSFVSRIGSNGDNLEVVTAIASLAHSLKMKVIAEGVETEEQIAKLSMLNCEYLQGYFFSKPVDMEKLENLLRQSRFDMINYLSHKN